MKRQHLLLAFAFHIIAAWFSVGRFHPDEQFQLIEFIGYKTGVNTAEQLAWEFHAEMRSTTQVAFGYACTKLFSFIENPFTQVFILRLISSLLALFALHRLVRYFRKDLNEKQYQLLSILSAIYCFIPFFHARFSSENVSTSLLILGFVTFLEAKKMRIYILVGLLLGLAYTVRMQSLFILFGFGLWVVFIKKEQFKGVLTLLFGFSISVFIGVLSDRWFYGRWVNTTWNYVYENIILHKSAQFGTQSIWYYFEKTLLDTIPPMSLVLICSILFFFIFKPKHVLTWMFIPFLLVHFVTPHKELRFLFPLINFVPLFFVLSWSEIETQQRFSSVKNFFVRSKYLFIKPIFWTVNSILLVYLCLKPADNNASTIEFIYSNYSKSSTLLLYSNNNPYDSNNCLNFLKAKNLSVQQISADTLKYTVLNTHSKTLFVATTDEVETLKNRGIKVQKVYSSIPKILYSFNYNSWINRTHKTEIYEISVNPFCR